jgi:hypothetical protein
MNQNSPDAHWWLGLCPKAPVFLASETGVGGQFEPAHEGSPDGGAGGPETIRRGIRAALSGTKTLIHNPQLLWFSFLAGLVLVAHLIIQWMLIFVNINSGSSDLILSPVVAFAVEFPTVFCLAFLLAGLTLSISSEKGGPVSLFHGLSMAKKYSRSLAGWSVVVALAGTLIFIAGWGSSLLLSSMRFNSFDIFGTLYLLMFNVLMQFPFNWTLNPDVVFGGVEYSLGMEYTLGVGFPTSFIYTLIFSAINTILFVLTLFVIPLLVLEGKRLKEAIYGSFTLMKNIRGEVTACVLGLGIVVFAASLTFLFFQFTGIDQVTGTQISSTRPGDAWIGFGLLYIIALTSFVFIAATIGGIATLELYKDAKIRESAK